MKYIIEIEDEPLVRKSPLNGDDVVYRAKGFKSLVFDKNGIEMLTPLEQYKPHLSVGDEVADEEYRYAYVLVPDYTKDDMVVLLEEYTSPQIVSKAKWEYTGEHSREIEKFVDLAAKALRKDK